MPKSLTIMSSRHDANDLSDLVDDEIGVAATQAPSSSLSASTSAVPASTSAFPFVITPTSTTTPTSISAPNDPYTALSKALALPAESAEQADALQIANDVLQGRPELIELICVPLLEAIQTGAVNPQTRDSIVKKWVLELLAFALGRSSLPLEAKASIAIKAVPQLSTIAVSPDVGSGKLAIQCVGLSYPMIFRAMCTSPSTPAALWQIISQAKSHIISLALAVSLDPATMGQPITVPLGLRIPAWKFVQRVVLVGTRGGSADPRRQDKADPNIMTCPPNHPVVKADVLAAEAGGLVEQMTAAFASDQPAVLHAVLNMIPSLIKLRPNLASSFIPAVCSWSPERLSAAGRPLSQTRSVEKTLKVVMVHLRQHLPAYAPQLGEANKRQVERIQRAQQEEREVRKSATSAAAIAMKAAEEDKRARLLLKREAAEPAADADASTAKRQRVRSPGASDSGLAGLGPKPSQGPLLDTPPALLSFDVTALGVDLTTDLLLRSLESATTDRLLEAMRRARRSSHLHPALSILGQLLGPEVLPQPVVQAALASQMPARLEEDEPDDMLLDPNEDGAIPSGQGDVATASATRDAPIVDPLNMLGDENDNEERFEVPAPTAEMDPKEEEIAATGAYVDFRLPPPPALEPDQQRDVILSALDRICKSGLDIVEQMPLSNAVLGDEDAAHVGFRVRSNEAYMLFVSRLATRGITAQDKDEVTALGEDAVRKAVAEYVCADFQSRSSLALVWLNEEWYNSKIAAETSGSAYTDWLQALVDSYSRTVDQKDRALAAFLLDVPEIPPAVLQTLRRLSESLATNIVGITTLRDLIHMRPPIRSQALQIVLDLTTHSERKIRLVPINLAKRWISEARPFNKSVLDYALQMVRKLAPEPNSADADGDEEEGEEHEERAVSTYMQDQLEFPVAQEVVQQHVELLVTLGLRDPTLLDEFFSIWPRLDESVRTSLETLLTPLIRNLGAANEPLLGLIRNFPPPAQQLALHMLQVLTESGKSTPELIALVTSLVKERDLDVRFLLPIASELDKADLLRSLPRICALLRTENGKETVQKAFTDIITGQNRQGDERHAAAADLLAALHVQEKQIGLKIALEAIDLCFSMSDYFPQQVLAMVLNRIVDETPLPTLSMRTIIKASQQCKALVGFVTTTLMPRLVAKKIWTTPQLWDGFIRISKMMAPLSLPALLALPRPQLKELVDKQPTLKPMLMQHVMQKGGAVRAQTYVDVS